MNRKLIANCLGLAGLALMNGQLTAQEMAASVPSGFVGTYELVFDEISSGSSFANGATVRAVITAEGDLCLDDLELSGPVHRNGNMAEAFWVDSSGGIEFGVSNFSNGAFNEVNVFGSGGSPFYGQFSGTLESTEADCSFDRDEDPLESQLSDEAYDIFSLAEELYPSLFNQRSELRQAQGFIYRFYAAARVYIGIRDGNVYVLGGPFGNSPTNRGAITATRSFLQDVRTRRQQPDVEVPDVDVSGLYDLTISGEVATVVSGFTAPPVDFNLTLNDVPAPDPEDLEQINSEISDTLSGVAGISSLEIVTDNNTDSRITFTVSFSAMSAGVSANYELTYDYVR